ncbi:MAG: hypothetical protein ACYTAQ_14110, partial [Planctomycetota bacterium]
MVLAEDLPRRGQDTLDVGIGGDRLLRIRGDEEVLEKVRDALAVACLLPGLDQARSRHRETGDQGGRDERRRGDAQAVPLDELAELVDHARGPRHHRLAGEIPLDVGGELARRLVAPGAVLLHRLHHDPVQVAPHEPAEGPGLGLLVLSGVGALADQRVEARGGLGRLHLPDDALDLAVARLAQGDRVKRRG